MSSTEKIKSSKFEHPPERLTLFSICCPCLRPKRLTCRASDIALVMYDKDEPHELVLEKLVIKRIPLRFFGVDEDFEEYQQSLKEESKTTCEKEVAVTNFEEIPSVQIEKKEENLPSEEMWKCPSKELKDATTQVSIEINSCSSSQVNQTNEPGGFAESKLSFPYQPITDPKSGEELILRTITANDQNDVVAEVDQRIAKMSPDLEKTINVLKAVKPRPVSTQGTPMPIKNQRSLTPRDVEHEGIITKDVYNYMPCLNDQPLLGVHYTLNKTTDSPATKEVSKSVVTDHPLGNTTDQISIPQTSKMVEEGTTNYEDATILAVDETDTYHPSDFGIPSLKNLSDDEDYVRSDNSSDSTTCIASTTPRRLRNLFNPQQRQTDIRNTDYTVCQANVCHRSHRRFPSPKRPKKQNLKWKIVINNRSRDNNIKQPPSSSTSEFKLLSKKKGNSKDFITKSGLSY